MGGEYWPHHSPNSMQFEIDIYAIDMLIYELCLHKLLHSFLDRLGDVPLVHPGLIQGGLLNYEKSLRSCQPLKRGPEPSGKLRGAYLPEKVVMKP